MHGRQEGTRDVLTGALKSVLPSRSAYIRHHRPDGILVAKGCRVMGLPRSTYNDAPPVKKLTTPLSLLSSPRSAMSLRLMAIGGLALSLAIAG